MSNNIDKLFKNALQDRSCEPPPFVWKNIEKQLGKQKRIRIWWLQGAAAAMIIAGLIGILNLQKNQEAVLPVAGNQAIDISAKEKESVKTPQDTGNTISGLEKTEAGRQIAEINSVSSINTPLLLSDNTLQERLHDQPIRLNAYAESDDIPNTVIESDIIRKRINNFIPLTNKEAFRNNKEYMALLGKTEVREQKKEKDKMKIGLSGHFVPTYSSGNYSTSAVNTRGYVYSKDQMDGMLNMGGGMKVSMAASKKISVQTGLFYSRMGQQVSEKNGPIFAAAQEASGNGKVISTPFGNVKGKSQEITYRNPEDPIEANTFSSEDESYEQVFNSLDIPLHVRYRFNDNKVAFSVMGGFSGNIIVDNKIYHKQGGSKEYMGSTDGIRTFNMSTDLSLGIEYALAPKIKLMFEPGIKYFLQSLSENSVINYKPYTFSLSTGIGIEF